MPVAAYALTTLEEAKAYLGVPDEDTDRDVTIENLVSQVSRQVLKDTGREFAPATLAGVTRTVEYRVGSGVIDLYPYDARAVTAIVIDPDGDYPHTLTATDWQLRPITNPDGVWDRIVLNTAGRFHSSAWDKVPAEVTGTWGWSEVPADVKAWVHEMVEDLWNTNVAYSADASLNLDESSVDVSNPFTVPYHIREGLARYQRLRIGAA